MNLDENGYIVGREAVTWPLDAERLDLVESWFSLLCSQTEQIAQVAELVAHRGLNASTTLADVVARVAKLVEQARFNAALCSHMRERRSALGLQSSGELEASMKTAAERLATMVAQIEGFAQLIRVVADAAAAGRPRN